jgi:hypothetical protein
MRLVLVSFLAAVGSATTLQPGATAWQEFARYAAPATEVSATLIFGAADVGGAIAVSANGVDLGAATVEAGRQNTLAGDWTPVGVVTLRWTAIALDGPLALSVANLSAAPLTLAKIMPALRAETAPGVWTSGGPTPASGIQLSAVTGETHNPEPATWLLIGGGLVLISARRLRRR